MNVTVVLTKKEVEEAVVAYAVYPARGPSRKYRVTFDVVSETATLQYGTEEEADAPKEGQE